MKISIATVSATAVLFLLQGSNAFVPASQRRNQRSQLSQPNPLNMFGGGGAGTAPEDDEGQQAEIEKAAKAMGMSVSEYQLATSARMQLAQTMDNTKCGSGSKDTIYVERDLNTPPKNLEIVITEEGKALGAKAVSDTLVKNLKKAAAEAKTGRAAAQQKMMGYIQEQLKG